MPCVFALGSEVPTRSDGGNQFLLDFIDLRDSLRQARIGSGGREVSTALTDELDRAISRLVSPLPDRVAVVALGGYGRGEMSPFSDVDLMLLHDMEDPSGLAADLFRPLWDAKLRVGHAVRTLGESASAAKERFDTQTTLITSRLVAGDDGLHRELMAEVTAVTKARPLRRHLVAEERARRAATPFLRMDVDVKSGRGGLRTLHGFEWERRREALIGRFSAEVDSAEDEARETLLRVRNALHVATGRRHDAFSTDLREPVARWLGREVFEVARELIEATRVVDFLAMRRWPESAEPEVPVGRRLWGKIAGRPESHASDRLPGLSEIVGMLETGEQGRLGLERLWEAGLINELLPEWGVIRGLPQLAPFHDHPVDAHLWRTVHEMQSLMSGDDRDQRVAQSLAEPGLALLTAFLHDIGKGQGRDHSEAGAEIAARFCSKIGVPVGWAGDVEHAVRHHLLLAETATRRDLDDPAVIDEVAATVGSLRRLQLLYLITIADSKATGPTMWSDWKATLLWTLFARCAGRLEGLATGDALPGISRADLLAAVDAGKRATSAAHVDSMPDDYLRSTSPADVLWHLELIATSQGRPDLAVRSGDPLETVVVVGPVSASFRRQVAEAFAANGIDVLEARMHTRADGLVVDSFQVRDDRTGTTLDPDRWERALHDIEAATAGRLDMVSKVEARASAYASEPTTDEEPVVRCSVDPATGDVVVAVKCSDRIGRLAEILGAIADCGLEVRLAKLDSRGDELIDMFHVRGGDAEPNVADLASLARLVAAGISP